MKFLLRLSLATLLIASTFAAGGTSKAAGNAIQIFISDPQIQAIAPHLVQQLSSSSSAFSPYNQDGTPLSTSSIADTKIPLLNDIIEIVSMTIFNAKTADWSRLEAAKLQAIQQHGEEAVNLSGDLNAMDMHHAAVLVKTIYDTVIHIPAANKATYAARAEDPKTKKSSGSFWDFLGFGLVKSLEVVNGVKALVSPESFGCETDDEAYLHGVNEVVYYSSLTDGLAGGTLAAAPADSAVKSLGLGTIIASVGKLAIELHMAQAVARLADLNPADDAVRAMIYLTLAASSPHDEIAQTARDLFNIKRHNLLSRVPFGTLKSLEDTSALALMTRGAGHANGSGGPKLFSGVPVLRNLFTFSNDVLGANSLGAVVKFVFCPEIDGLKQPIVTPGGATGQQRMQKNEQQKQEKKRQEQEQDHEQKVLKIAKRSLRREEAIKNAMFLAKQRAEAAQDKEL
ncbi:hypothetical protein BG015_006291 [Linnemannia schmuckeri]|uniref:Uncharacterized protein n=1 Tax=Linnemannia schmuckeri TaxID=64567 RepID=A0A9P5S2J5_9FUNG|nr:hypothetical protein BG015_006291 [Linnemannia schmuckeri]